MSRGSGSDLFSTYAAEGRRNKTARVLVHPLPAAVGGRRSSNDGGPCPTAMLLGIDATPEPGLRGPTNFVGVLTAAMLRTVRQTIDKARHQLR